MTKDELRKRVSARKSELESQITELSEFKESLVRFVDDVKGRSAVYALIKNLPLWKKLTELIQYDR